MINRKQLYIIQTSSRWKKVNKMIHFTVIADLNVVFYSSICQLYNCQKLWFCNRIWNFSNIILIKTNFFNVNTLKRNGI